MNHTEALNLIETGQCLFYFLQMCYNITFGGNFITQTSAPRRVDNENVPPKGYGNVPPKGYLYCLDGQMPIYLLYIYIYYNDICVYAYIYICTQIDRKLSGRTFSEGTTILGQNPKFPAGKFPNIVRIQIHPAAAACVAARWTRNMGVFLNYRKLSGRTISEGTTIYVYK